MDGRDEISSPPVPCSGRLVSFGWESYAVPSPFSNGDIGVLAALEETPFEDHLVFADYECGFGVASGMGDYREGCDGVGDPPEVDGAVWFLRIHGGSGSRLNNEKSRMSLFLFFFLDPQVFEADFRTLGPMITRQF